MKRIFLFMLVLILFVESKASILDNKVDSGEEGPTNEQVQVTTKYEPTWSSLDARPLPTWYDEAKIGIFIHWGVFSVPSLDSEWFWKYWHDNSTYLTAYMKEYYPPGFTYQDFATEFTTALYNATEWVDLFIKSGAKYVVLTAKHHEGYTNWPSKYSFGWNSMDVGPHRDLVGELANAVRNRSSEIRFGLYHSQFEFFNPLFLEDQANSFKTDRFSRFKSTPELYELVNAYKPEVIWSDGDGGASAEYWKSQEFIAWLYNDSPVKDTVLVNDRWGDGCSCKHGGFYNCMDNYNPGKLQVHKWENAFPLDKHAWGYRRNSDVNNYRPFEEILDEVVPTISCGGNALLNIGPTKDGTIIPIMQERLLQLGQWLNINGDAIYNTRPWSQAQNDSISGNIWYTIKPSIKKLFAIVLQNYGEPNKFGQNDKIVLGSMAPADPTTILFVELLGYPGKQSLKWNVDKTKPAIVIDLPIIMGSLKTNYGWTIAITYKDSHIKTDRAAADAGANFFTAV